MKAVLLVAAALAAGPSDVRSTKHNLSAGSTNAVRAQGLDEICVFCHVPHGAYQSRPIWNRDLRYQDDVALYNVYGSTTLDAVVGRPTGAAKLCLSCHDGTLAIGSLMNLDAIRPASVPMAGGTTTMPPGPRLLGTDLRNDHPVSMVPNVAADPEIRLPPPGDDVRLREGSTPGVKDTVQCTSCHDPHLPTFKFLVKDNARGALCLTCHDKPGWLGSRHEASLAPYPAVPAPGAPATTVGDLGCLACHAPHNGTSPSRLLQTSNRTFGTPFPWAEENVCFSCHQAGGTGIDPARGRAAPDIRSQMQKLTHHPVELKTDEHQPVFTNHLPTPETTLNATKHVECADCHNPHRVQALPGNVHEGMKGIPLSGLGEVVDDPGTDLRQYEVCFRCHGDTFATMIPPAPTRPPSGSNKRLEFQPTNAAFHPVPGPGRNQSTYLNNVLDDGQLQGNDWEGNRLSRFSTVLCTDCHNNEATADVQGSARSSPSGPKGPHGSSNVRMLRANYAAVTGTAGGAPFGGYSNQNFALCFLCHNEGRLLGTSGPSRSNFFQAGGVGAGRGNLHNVHLRDRTNAACHECHYNIHSNVQAANTDYRNIPPGEPTHLVNFAPSVRPFPGNDPHFGDRPALPRYGRTPDNRPYCFLSCHGRDAMDGDKSIYLPPNP